MRFERRFTTADQSPYAAIEFGATKSEIRNPDGSVVFSGDLVSWTQSCSVVLARDGRQPPPP